MRLLTPQEKKDTEQEEESKKQKKAIEINEVLTREVKNLNEFREKDRLEIATIKREHADFLAAKAKERARLEREVALLEERRSKALKPLDQIRIQLDSRKKELDKAEKRLSKRADDLLFREIEVRELADKYTKRLGDLKDSEAELKNNESILKEEQWRFAAMMKYKESAIENNRKKLRDYFEAESRKLKELKK